MKIPCIRKDLHVIQFGTIRHKYNIEIPHKESLLLTNICQNVDCNNIGREVTVQMVMEDNSERIEKIYLCQICINLQNAINGGLKN